MKMLIIEELGYNYVPVYLFGHFFEQALGNFNMETLDFQPFSEVFGSPLRINEGLVHGVSNSSLPNLFDEGLLNFDYSVCSGSFQTEFDDHIV